MPVFYEGFKIQCQNYKFMIKLQLQLKGCHIAPKTVLIILGHSTNLEELQNSYIH